MSGGSGPGVAILGAARTPIGSLMGAFAAVPAHALGTVAIKAALERSGVEPGEVDEVVLGQVLTAAAGQNPARQAAMAAGIPETSTALGVNQVCGSGLRAVAMGLQAIRTGDAGIVVAGGQESMSMAPHAARLRGGQRLGSLDLADTMMSEGLTDAFLGYPMGVTAENVAREHQVTREEQDIFAALSQARAEAAVQAGRFRDEIAPVTVPGRKGDTIVEADEGLRSGTTPETLARLRPVFAEGGTVTAGNASTINDGAAALVLASEDEAARRGAEPLARIVSWATAGVDPALMGTGPIPASREALRKAGWSADSLDLVEANEAFAAQAVAVNRAMGWDPAIVNVNGGAIALGHPIGASGARVLVTLLHEMRRRGARRGLATLCIGGGMGIAMTVENLSVER